MNFTAKPILVVLLAFFSLAAVAKTPPTTKPNQQSASDSTKAIRALDLMLEEDEELFEDELEQDGVGLADSLKNAGMLVPAADIYPIWTNAMVNPYNIKLEDSVDSLRIDLANFVFPLTTHYRVNSEFGFRRSRHHNGIDLKVNVGDSVVAAFDGMVRMAKASRARKGYGTYVVIRHDNGLETVYGHLNKLNVEENQVVKAGELIGEGGNTGRSTGPHLHFEVRYLGQPINPRDLIDFDKLACHHDSLLLHKGNFAYVKEVEKTRVWVVKSGDSLGRIASKTGVPISRLCSLNKINKNSILRIGQRIRYT